MEHPVETVTQAALKSQHGVIITDMEFAIGAILATIVFFVGIRYLARMLKGG